MATDTPFNAMASSMASALTAMAPAWYAAPSAIMFEAM